MNETQQATCVCVIAYNSDGKILTVETSYQNRGHGLPGGLVDPGESAEIAAVRELFEETGLSPKGDLRLVYLAKTNKSSKNIVATYLVEVEGVPISSDEGIASWQDPKILCEQQNMYANYNRAALLAAGFVV